MKERERWVRPDGREGGREVLIECERERYINVSVFCLDTILLGLHTLDSFICLAVMQ